MIQSTPTKSAQAWTRTHDARGRRKFGSRRQAAGRYVPPSKYRAVRG